MLLFIIIWTVGSSLIFFLVAFISIVFNKFKIDTVLFPGIKFLIFWLLLGITQWTIMHPYVDWAYRWGLVNIIDGFLGSLLFIFINFLIYLKFILTFSPSIGSNPAPDPKNLDTARKVLAIFSVIIGACFGLYQSYILPITFGYINYCIALLNGMIWLIIAVPQVTSDRLVHILKSNSFLYSVSVALLGGIYSYLQSLLMIHLL